MNIAEIQDAKSLERWLKYRPTDVASQIAIRCALRVFPVFGRMTFQTRARKPHLTALPVLRALMTLAVERRYLVPRVSAAAAVAVAAANAGALADPAAAIARSLLSLVHSVAARSTDAAFAPQFAAGAAGEVDGKSFIWEQVREDARMIEQLDDTMTARLWSIPHPRWFQQVDREMRAIWAKDPDGTWDFWLRWYQAVLDGKRVNLELLIEIVLLPNEDWERGPAHIATLIAKIEGVYPFFGGYVEEGYFEEGYVDQDAGQSEILHELDTQIARIPSATRHQIQTTRKAIIINREALPPTFDALDGYIALEVARLQSLNYVSDDHRDDCLRQIRVLITVNSAVSRLREIVTLPTVSNDEAAKIEKLGRVYVRLFQDWPRSNAPDLVDSTCRAALVGMSTVMLTMIGVSATAAVTVGAVMFGGKKLVDGVRAAKDAISLSK